MAMFRYRNYCKNFPHTCQTKTKTSVYRNRWTSVNIYILYFQRHMYVHMFHIGIVKRILCPRVIVALRRLWTHWSDLICLPIYPLKLPRMPASVDLVWDKGLAEHMQKLSKGSVYRYCYKSSQCSVPFESAHKALKQISTEIRPLKIISNSTKALKAFARQMGFAFYWRKIRNAYTRSYNNRHTLKFWTYSSFYRTSSTYLKWTCAYSLLWISISSIFRWLKNKHG